MKQEKMPHELLEMRGREEWGGSKIKTPYKKVSKENI